MDRWIFLIASAIFKPSSADALGRIDQPFAGWIIARPTDERADRFLDIFGNVWLVQGILRIEFPVIMHVHVVHGYGFHLLREREPARAQTVWDLTAGEQVKLPLCD